MKNLLICAAVVSFTTASFYDNMTKQHTRLLPLEGAYNVRDLGGYTGYEGRTVKWRTVIRSGDLNLLTDADLDYLSSVPIVSYVDFRDSNEIRTAPDRRPASLRNDFQIPIEAGSVVEMRQVLVGNTDNLMVMANEMFVREFQPQFSEFFRLLSDPCNLPLLFHCSAGKDRTGFAAAMFLSALGVDRETIITDYMMSAELVRDKYAADVEKYPSLEPLMTVHRRYIEGAFQVIDSQYGEIETYLTEELGVDLELMRELFLE